MDYRRRQNTEDAKVKLENQIAEGERFLEVSSLPGPKDLETYQERICEWRNATYALLQDVYNDPDIQSIHCPAVEKSDFSTENRNEARDRLKAEVSKIVDSLKELLSKWG
ncbi:MAG TPA: hypothetical protein VJ302_34420 [Blastocatellia bacterium]|nr:hypothetical protein [Blastocatellia bacterium]